MELGSPESLRLSILDLQKTFVNMDQDFRAPRFVMKETAQVVPLSDFLGWEETGEPETRLFPSHDKLLHKKLAYWITGHGTVPLILDRDVLQWKADEMMTPGTGILRASHFILPGQIRLRDSEVYFL